MKRLPFRPWIFVSAFLGLYVVSAMLMFNGALMGDFLPWIINALLSWLQLTWVWQATAFAADQSAARGHPKEAARTLGLAKVLAITGAVAIGAFIIGVAVCGSPIAKATCASGPNPIWALAIIGGSSSFLALHWVAASAVCYAERLAGDRNPHVLGTFLQFVYLIFGATFIYRRLVALRDASIDEAPPPA